MSITDGNWICAKCFEYRTQCYLCGPNGAELIPTPQSIKDKEKEDYEKLLRSIGRKWRTF